MNKSFKKKIFNYEIEYNSYILHPIFRIYDIILYNKSSLPTSLLRVKDKKYYYWNDKNSTWINVKKIKTAYKHAFLELYLNTNIH